MAPKPFVWNFFAKGYAKRPVPDAAAYQHKLDVTRQYLSADAKVLEIGCGTGTTALYHAPVVGHIRAIDFSIKMIAIARQKAETAGVTNVDFEISALEDLADAPDTYDMIMAHSILHLVDDRGSVLRRCHAMLKPGSVFVSSTVCIGNPNLLVRGFAKVLRATSFGPNIHLLSEDQLASEFEAAGFEIVERTPQKPRAALFMVARKPA